jgi:hypothetical protein
MKMKMVTSAMLAALSFSLVTGFSQKPQQLEPAVKAADVILQNGNIYTVDENRNWEGSLNLV